ncbi:MAG TPA: glycosyltransferase family 1 protein [Terracidiphilus sp.]|nr:glycosyltransferase family 1 protein [Terracidiphilus sp.]
MIVVVAAVSANRSMSGVSRHASNLVRCLIARPEVKALHVLVAPWEHNYVGHAIARVDPRLHIHAVPLKPGTLRRNLWYYKTLPEVARQLRADVVHVGYPAPIHGGDAFPCPTVVTLHDLYPYDIPSNFGFPKVLFNRIILRQALRNASAIACVSESTRIRLGRAMPELLSKTVIIYNCVESAPMAVKPSFVMSWDEKPFIFCVAQHRRNKNIHLAIRAFERVLKEGLIDPETRLLIVGMGGPESSRIYRYVRDSELTRHIVFASGISDAEMNWCYRNCDLLLIPSSVEGFGLPIAEAQLAGCRIACSDIPAFREVGGDGCRFVPLGPGAEQRFAAAIVACLGDDRPVPARLPQFMAKHIAKQYVELYMKLSSSSCGEPPKPVEGPRPVETHNTEPFERGPRGEEPTVVQS